MIKLTAFPSKTKGTEFWVAWKGGLRVGNLHTIRKGSKLFVNIIMNKPYRDKGYGTDALKAFMKQTRHPVVYAETRKSNASMRRVFEKLGWKPVQKAKGFQAMYVWHK